MTALLSGALILRRRGVYFSLLTLALTALLFAIGYRWTEFTGGESGLGGVSRSTVLGIDLERDWTYYWAVAAIGMAICWLLWRFHRSPAGSVLVAIRENEERARFVGYPTNRYKLVAFVLSAAVVAVAGTLSVFNHRFASAEPLSVAFSGELIAMVVIGGMRSFLGPALGALFFILFREFLSIWTAHWLFWFGLLFVGFIVFSPTGLVGVAGRLIAPFRARTIEAAAMAGRTITTTALPQVYRRSARSEGPVLVAQGLVKRFGGIHAVDGVALAVEDRTLHALIGPNGAGKTTAFNLVSGLFAPDSGAIALDGRSIAGLKPESITRAGVGRSFQITNLFAGLSAQENLRLAVQARSAKRFAVWTSTESLADVTADTADLIAFLGLSGIEAAEAASLSYGGQRLLDMGLALATRPRILLLDEPLAGLAVAERERIAALMKTLSAEIPVLFVEHDIDRVFQIADRVTVMNEGKVLVDGGVEDARGDAKVREVYIGSGTAALAAKPRASAAEATPLLVVDKVDTFYGKSHILNAVSLDVREHEIVALLGRNGAGKSTLLKTLVGIAAPENGAIRLAGRETARLPSAEIARRGIGYVPQGRGLFAGMTVADNLALGRLKRLTGAGIHWDDDRIRRVLPAARRALAHAGRLSVRRRAADGGGGPRACRRRARAAARRAVRRALAGGDRRIVRGLRSHAPRDRDARRRPSSRSGAGAVGPHGGAGARRRELGRRLADAQGRPRAEEKDAVDVNERVAIVGSGLIGRSWAIVFAGGGCEVALYDSSAGTAAQAHALVTEGLAELAAHGLIEDARDAAARVRVAKNLADALGGASFVQENTPETVETKQVIFAELDRLAAPDAILASSTSTIVASRFTENLAGRHRCLVAHPVNPPHLVPLVELVAAPWTAPGTLAKAKAIYEAVGQVPIVVKREIEGFILNRLQAVLLAEAFRLVEDGYVTPQDLDKTVKHGLGLRWSFMGPFETIELNAPGGIPDYCRRYGASLAQLSEAKPAIFGTPLVDRILMQWKQPAADEIAARMRWRDKRLAAIKAQTRVDVDDEREGAPTG